MKSIILRAAILGSLFVSAESPAADDFADKPAAAKSADSVIQKESEKQPRNESIAESDNSGGFDAATPVKNKLSSSGKIIAIAAESTAQTPVLAHDRKASSEKAAAPSDTHKNKSGQPAKRSGSVNAPVRLDGPARAHHLRHYGQHGATVPGSSSKTADDRFGQQAIAGVSEDAGESGIEGSLLNNPSDSLMPQNPYEPERTSAITYLDVLTGKSTLHTDGVNIGEVPKYGTFRMGKKGEVVYKAPDMSLLVSASRPIADIFDEFSVILPNGSVIAYKVYFASDPFLIKQWYIKNYGLDAYDVFAVREGRMLYPRMGYELSGKPGLDLNVSGAWKRGHTGKGVNVVVYDNGVDARNSDLEANILADRAVDFSGQSYSFDSSDYAGRAHGTAVAGIVAAVGSNGKGIRGIAYDAKIIPWKTSGDISDFAKMEFSSDIGVLTSSVTPYKIGNGVISGYGSEAKETFGMALASDIAFFQSVGNVHNKPLTELHPDGTLEVVYAACYVYGTDCFFSNPLDKFPIYYPIVNSVAGVDSNGAHLVYSNSSAGNAFSAFGQMIDSRQTGYDRGKGILSTGPVGDAMDNFKRFSSDYDFEFGEFSDYFSQFYGGELEENNRMEYIGLMNGTSSAAPMAAGVAALVRSVNPELTAADVADIMIRTARRSAVPGVPKSIKDKKRIWFEDGEKLIILRKDKANGAGLVFDNLFGYGLIDAERAVAVAENYQPGDRELAVWAYRHPYRLKFSSLEYAPAKKFSDAAKESESAMSKQFVVADAVLEIPASFVEHFGTASQCGGIGYAGGHRYVTGLTELNDCKIKDFTFLQIEVQSPSGTVSVLKPMGAAVYRTGDTPGAWRIASKAFYGENAEGVWKIRIISSLGEDPKPIKEALSGKFGKVSAMKNNSPEPISFDARLLLYPGVCGQCGNTEILEKRRNRSALAAAESR